MAPRRIPQRKNKPGAGRPPASPEAKAHALDLMNKLGSPEEAAEQLRREGVKVASGRQIREWANQARLAALPSVPEAAPPPEPSSPPIAAPAAAAGERPPTPRERPPPGLTGNALQLWYVQRQIEMVSVALATASGPDGQLARIAPLNEQLRKWLGELDRLSPKEEADPAAEERRWREEASRVRARVEAGVRAFEEG